MSLASYHPDDLSFFTSNPSLKIQNLCGVVGAAVAGVARAAIGVTAYLIPFLGFLWAAGRFTGKPMEKPPLKFLAAVLFCVASSSVLSMVWVQTMEARVYRGGMVGLAVSGQMIHYCGWWGAFVVLATVGLLCFLLSTELMFWPLLDRAGKLVAAPFRWFTSAGEGLAAAAKTFPKTSSRKEDLLHRLPKPIIREQGKRETAPARTGGVTVGATLKGGTHSNASSPNEKPVIIQQDLRAPERPVQRESAKVAASEVCRVVEEEKEKGPTLPYRLPSLDLLDPPAAINSQTRRGKQEIEQSAKVLEDALREFGIDAKVTEVEVGPVITRYEVEPAPGVKVQRITTLSDDLALVMKAQSVRIIAPIPGKARVGIEVPNASSVGVTLREVLESSEFRESGSKLALAIGKDTAGHPLVSDLGEMPHLLIAGTTGSGKTVCMNSLIASLLFNATPEEVRFMMVDPKMVELTPFNGLPHLLTPVLTDPKKVPLALQWVIEEMENRYRLFAKLGVRNIDGYHEKEAQGQLPSEELPASLPFIVVIMDELADLMLVAQAEVEKTIARLAHLSRAVGIHMILATQRPSVDVLTGVIKANLPARLSFQVASRVDSRTVLDSMGAEKLLGKGDLLFMQPGSSKLVRAQGCLLTDKEIERVVSFIKAQRGPQYEPGILEGEARAREAQQLEKDVLYSEALRVVVETGQASVSLLQRRMRLGYGRAARILDMMEQEGIVGPIRGAKPREVYLKEVPDESGQAVDRRASEVGA